MIASRIQKLFGAKLISGGYLSTHHLAKSLVPPWPTHRDHNSHYDAIPLLEDDVGILVAALQAPDSSSAKDPPCGARFPPFVLSVCWSLPGSTTKPRRTFFLVLCSSQ